jgi:hypothetical protein
MCRLLQQFGPEIWVADGPVVQAPLDGAFEDRTTIEPSRLEQRATNLGYHPRTLARIAIDIRYW